MPIAVDVRKARAAVADARKPLYAVVGAGELAVARTASQLRELPAETQTAVRARLDDVRTRVAGLGRAGAAQVRGAKPAELRALLETYLDQARKVYDELASRGEKVVGKVAEQPRVRTVLTRAETLLDRTGETVETAAAGLDLTAEETVAAATRPKAPARRTTTRRSTAK